MSVGAGGVAGTAALLLLAAISLPAQVTTLHLEGTVEHSNLHSYLEVPFDVPEGVAEIAVRFDYDTRDQRTTLDLGLLDPRGFRGWSGGSRDRFTVAPDHATPGYLPGPIEAGTWHLLLGVPNIREGIRAHYTATVELWTSVHEARANATEEIAVEAPPPSRAAVSSQETKRRDQPGWYRGDLHVHTEHSDGTCLIGRERRPCPLEQTLTAARARGLDFVAITEHNTISHFAFLPEASLAKEQAPQSDADLTVLPGQEVTTFRGHLNVVGISQRLAFRNPDGKPRDPNAIAEEARGLGAFVIVNHPRLPSGEACMGCGWHPAEPTTDQVHAVEVINGGVMKTRNGSAEGIFSGIPFWERGLSGGRRWIAIGASDNHDPLLGETELGRLGKPTTVVWARSASAADLIEGLRSGRAFVDVEGHPTRTFDVRLQTRAGEHPIFMGGHWTGPAAGLELVIDCNHCVGLEAELLLGTTSTRRAGPTGVETLRIGRFTDSAPRLRYPLTTTPSDLRWLRVDLRRADGTLVVLGNAIHWSTAPAAPKR